MWANAQRDGRPAEYRWRPLFNAAKDNKLTQFEILLSKPILLFSIFSLGSMKLKNSLHSSIRTMHQHLSFLKSDDVCDSNTALTIDSPKETKEPHNKPLNTINRK